MTPYTKHINSFFFFFFPDLKVISTTLAKDSCVLRINDRVDCAPDWPLLTAGSQSPASAWGSVTYPLQESVSVTKVFSWLRF